jgi:hypothetical protein
MATVKYSAVYFYTTPMLRGFAAIRGPVADVTYYEQQAVASHRNLPIGQLHLADQDG